MINVISYINIDHREGTLFTDVSEVDDILNGERDDIYAVATEHGRKLGYAERMADVT